MFALFLVALAWGHQKDKKDLKQAQRIAPATDGDAAEEQPQTAAARKHDHLFNGLVNHLQQLFNGGTKAIDDWLPHSFRQHKNSVCFHFRTMVASKHKCISVAFLSDK